MTPSKRRRLFRAVFILMILMIAGFGSRVLFLNQSAPALLLGRKPGSAKPGTLLVQSTSLDSTSQPIQVDAQKGSGDNSHSPLKLKFETLGGWKFIEGKTSIPDKVKELNGKWVELTGFMMPINEIQNLTRFIVIQSLWGCCFGQTPEVNHIIVVNMEAGKTAQFYPEPVTVVGKFSVAETREEGFLVSIYQMEANSVVVR